MQDNKILRLKKEIDFYINEISKFKSSFENTSDPYTRQLLLNQIDETERALGVVQKKVKEYENVVDM